MGRPVVADLVYPELDGFERVLQRKDKWVHIGYAAPPGRVRRCNCGELPVFEQYVGDKSPSVGKSERRNVPAKVFVAICPVCERRAAGEGTIEEVLANWNNKRMSYDSELVARSPKDMSDEAMAALVGVLVTQCMEEAVELIHERHRIMNILKSGLLNDEAKEIYYNKHREVCNELHHLDHFFKTSPFTEGRDTDAILSDIRKEIYPGKTMKDIEARMKIPLDLERM